MKTKPRKKPPRLKKDFRKFWSVVKREKLLGLYLVLAALLLFLPSLSLYQRKNEVPKIPKISIPLFPYPVEITGARPPSLSAKSMVVMDIPSSVILTAKNENLKLLPASTTKIMTALVALESYPQEPQF